MGRRSFGLGFRGELLASSSTIILLRLCGVLVGGAVGAGQVGVGFGVVADLAGGLVPFQGAA